MEDSQNSIVVRLKDAEIFKIKLCLSSLTNTVTICPVISSIYTKNTEYDEWTHAKKGAPCMILLHDVNRDIAGAQICMADPETGFAVWRESVTKNCDYKLSDKNFHSFKLMDSDKGIMAGIKFPTIESSNIFLRDILCSLPDENALSKEGSPKSIERKRFTKKLKKDEISSPCMFTHVSSISSKKKTSTKKPSFKRLRGSGSSLDAPNADST